MPKRMPKNYLKKFVHVLGFLALVAVSLPTQAQVVGGSVWSPAPTPAPGGDGWDPQPNSNGGWDPQPGAGGGFPGHVPPGGHFPPGGGHLPPGGGPLPPGNDGWDPQPGNGGWDPVPAPEDGGWDRPGRPGRGRPGRGRPGPGDGLIPVFRSFNGDNHLMSLDPNEGPRQGYRYEGVAFHTFAGGGRGLQPLFRCYVPGQGHFASLDNWCEGQVSEGSLGNVSRVPTRMAPRELVRCYNGRRHLITANAHECFNSGYHVEHVLGYVR